MRLQVFALAHDPGNFPRQLAPPREVSHWSVARLRESRARSQTTKSTLIREFPVTCT